MTEVLVDDWILTLLTKLSLMKELPQGFLGRIVSTAKLLSRLSTGIWVGGIAQLTIDLHDYIRKVFIAFPPPAPTAPTHQVCQQVGLFLCSRQKLFSV